MGIRDNGHVSSHSLPKYEKTLSLEHYFGLMKVRIDGVVYVDDPKNNSFEKYGFKTVQYLCRIIGSQFDGSYIQGVIDAGDLGGEFNYSETIRSGVEEQALETSSGDLSTKYANGDYALVLNLYGDKKKGAIIIKGYPHPRNKKIGATKADGKRDRSEFNGVETHIDKDGNYRVRIVGKKNSKGVTQNPEGVGSELILRKNGDFEFNAYGSTEDNIPESSTSKDCRITFTKADKKIELYANSNEIVSDESGITMKEKGGATLKLFEGKVGLGKSSVELLEQISKQLDKLTIMIISMATETHPGNLGYPTGFPSNASDYIEAKTELTAIKQKIDSIKGGV